MRYSYDAMAVFLRRGGPGGAGQILAVFTDADDALHFAGVQRARTMLRDAEYLVRRVEVDVRGLEDM